MIQKDLGVAPDDGGPLRDAAQDSGSSPDAGPDQSSSWWDMDWPHRVAVTVGQLPSHHGPITLPLVVPKSSIPEAKINGADLRLIGRDGSEIPFELEHSPGDAWENVGAL